MYRRLREIRRFALHAILDPSKMLVVKDATEDVRFADNPLVTEEPNIRFYAGTPLITHDNFALGTLCVIDYRPRELYKNQLAALEALGRQVSLRLELRRKSDLLKKANEELRNLSLMDDLTGLYNRRGFFLHAEQQLKLYRSRESERSVWVMVGDFDGLKQINDAYGHPEGSAAIIKTAEILTITFRDADILARLGGDEFTGTSPKYSRRGCTESSRTSGSKHRGLQRNQRQAIQAQYQHWTRQSQFRRSTNHRPTCQRRGRIHV